MSTSPAKNLPEFLGEAGDSIDRFASQLDALSSLIGSSGDTNCTGLAFLLEDIVNALADTATSLRQEALRQQVDETVKRHASKASTKRCGERREGSA